jgi:radical SAM superfamily enzyme YgiQ (UPF0313 family)
MRILFIYTREIPQSPVKPLTYLDAIQFGISYISAFLKKHGHETRLLVLTRQSDFSSIDAYLAEFSPQVVAFTAVATEYPFVEKIGLYIKTHYPDLFLLIGGVHVSLAPDDSMLDTFDALCVGEGEEAMLELVQQLERGELPSGIPNLWIKKAGVIEKIPMRPFLRDLDALPFPDRGMWDEWIDLSRSSKRPTLLLGRGCPYDCTYCCNHALRKLTGGRYVRTRSPENIIREIEEVLEQLPMVREFYLEIETFGANWNWSMELCALLEKLNAKRAQPLAFGVNMRITSSLMKRDLDEYFSRLKKSNFRYVHIGLESGSERVRREILRRDYSNAEISRAVAIAKKHGLEVMIFNLIGLPTETLDDFHETVRMNQICLPGWSYHSIFYPYPGTDLYNQCKQMGVLPHDLLDHGQERVRAILDFPEFSREQIQKAYIWFDYYVYHDHKPVSFLANLVVYKYRQIYGADRNNNLPAIVAKDLLDPSLRFDAQYHPETMLNELIKFMPQLKDHLPIRTGSAHS